MSSNSAKETVATRRVVLDLVGLVVWLLFSFLIAAFGAQFEPGSWYRQLVRPEWTPPNWLFGPVWTFLYIAMAVAAWLVWCRGGLRRNLVALSVYGLQLVLNGLWSWLFFGQHLIGLALIDIVLLLAAIVITTVLFFKRRILSGVLMLPYALWVSFATALNFQIWRLN